MSSIVWVELCLKPFHSCRRVAGWSSSPSTHSKTESSSGSFAPRSAAAPASRMLPCARVVDSPAFVSSRDVPYGRDRTRLLAIPAVGVLDCVPPRRWPDEPPHERLEISLQFDKPNNCSRLPEPGHGGSWSCSVRPFGLQHYRGPDEPRSRRRGCAAEPWRSLGSGSSRWRLPGKTRWSPPRFS